MTFGIHAAQPLARPPVASMFSRYAARFLDGLILGIPARIALVVTGAAFDSELVQWSIVAAWSLGAALLQVSWLATSGRSPGRRALKIRVVNATTYRRITWRESFIREFSYLLLAITVVGLVVDIVTAWTREDRRSLHDRFAGTIVVSAAEHEPSSRIALRPSTLRR